MKHHQSIAQVVNMPLTLWNGVCLCVLLGSLSTVICGSSDVNTTCSAQPAKEGQRSAIDLYFHGIDFSADQFSIVLEKDHKDILRCGDYEAKGAKTCTVLHGSFESPGIADQNMTVIIPVANHSLHHGIYVLRTHFNGNFLSATSCKFIISSDHPTPDSTTRIVTTVKTHTNATHDPLTAGQDETTGQPGPDIVPIVVPAVLAIFVVIVVIVIAAKRRNRRQYDQAPTDDTCEKAIVLGKH